MHGWEPFNELGFKTRARNLTFVQVYAPTDAADLQDKEKFYSELSGVVNKIPKGDIRIHVSDFNAKIGSENTDLERIMGSHGLEGMCKIGELSRGFRVMVEEVTRKTLLYQSQAEQESP